MGIMARALQSERHHLSFLGLSAITRAGGGRKVQGGLLCPVTTCFSQGLHALGKQTVEHQETSLTC